MAQALVSMMGTIGACLQMRIKIEGVIFGFCGSLFSFHTRFGTITIGYLPTGGYVKYNTKEYEDLSIYYKSFIILGGSAAALLCTFCCLGLQETMRQILTGFPQLVRIGLAPLSYGRPAIALFFAKAQISAVGGFGIYMAKMIAMNLFPLPIMPFGHLLMAIAGKRRESTAINLGSVVTVLALPLLIGWGIAIISYFWQIR
jgi:membrane-associated protease RseP (regulator of RpoE activity)